MTQDQWDQPRNTGFVVRGEVVPDEEPGVTPVGQAPMTYFQKVASRVHQPGQPDDQDPDETRGDEERAVSSPDAGHDYWDDDEGTLQAGPAGESAAGPAGESAAGPARGAAASVGVPTADPGASSPAPAGQAEEVADEAGPAGRYPADHSMTQPSMAGATAWPPAATVPTVPTVPIAVAEEPSGDAERPAAAEAAVRPGESGTAPGLGETGYASLLTDTADLRARWHRIQYKFVDEPRVSVTEAADVIAQVAARLEAAIAERQRGLRGRWDTAGAVDTESLRETLRMYRSFLDQLIGPEPS